MWKKLGKIDKKFIRLKRGEESIHINKEQYKEETGLTLKSQVMDYKLVYYLLSVLQSINADKIIYEKNISVDIRDYPENFTKKQYRDTVAKKMLSAKCTYIKNRKITHFNILEKVSYSKDDIYILDLLFTDEAINAITNLREFTILDLQNMSECNTVYEIVLYVLFSKWINSEYVNFEITIENFRALIGKGTSTKVIIREISKAIPRVNKNMGLDMDFEKIYKDNNERRIHKIEFYDKS
jgi:hypothetical protein